VNYAEFDDEDDEDYGFYDDEDDPLFNPKGKPSSFDKDEDSLELEEYDEEDE
jgi:hypothetical protein